MSILDRYYLQSDPEPIIQVSSPSVVTLWVPHSVDMEDETIECSRVYVTIEEEEKCRLWKGTPLMFEMFHKFNLEAGQRVWAVTRDHALVGIQVDPIQ